MKRSITLFVVLCFSALCYAEHEYLPFLKQGKKWVCLKGVMELPVNKQYGFVGGEPYYYIIQGDTIIAEENYMKLYKSDSLEYGNSNLHYYACLKEENRMVYIIRSGAETPEVLYDYNMENGQIERTIHGQKTWLNVEVYDKGPLYEYSAYTEDLLFGYKYYVRFGSLIEPFDCNGEWDNDRRLIYCEEDGIGIFGEQPERVHLPINENYNNQDYFDLQGRQVLNPQKGSIYIQGNRKIYLK